MPDPRRDAASNGGSSVTVAVTSTAIVAANPSRVTLMLANLGSTTVYLKFQSTPGTAPTATTAAGFPLAQNATYVTNDFSGAVAGIVSTGTADVRVVEL